MIVLHDVGIETSQVLFIWDVLTRYTLRKEVANDGGHIQWHILLTMTTAFPLKFGEKQAGQTDLSPQICIPGYTIIFDNKLYSS